MASARLIDCPAVGISSYQIDGMINPQIDQRLGKIVEGFGLQTLDHKDLADTVADGTSNSLVFRIVFDQLAMID